MARSHNSPKSMPWLQIKLVLCAKASVIFLSICSMGIVGQAAIVTSTSSMAPASVVIDFEAFGLGQTTPLFQHGLTMTTDLPSGVFHSSSVAAPEVSGLFEGQFLRPTSTNFASDYAFQFQSPVSEFGLAIVDAEFSGNVLRAYDASNVLLEEVALGNPAFPPAPLSANFLGFRRATNEIMRVELITPANDFVGVDSIHFHTIPPSGPIFVTEVETNYPFENRQVIPPGPVGFGRIIVEGSMEQFWTVDSGEADLSSAVALSQGMVNDHNFFNRPPGTPYFAFIDNTTGMGSPDTILRALDSMGNQLTLNDDGSPLGNGFGSAFNSIVNPDGSIRLQVTGYPDSSFVGQHEAAGDYALHIQLGVLSASGALDPVEGNAVISHEFFNLPPGTPYAAYVDNDTGSGTPDTLMRARDEVGNQLITDDDNSPVGTGAGSGLNSTVNTDGSVRLEVTGYPDNSYEGQHEQTGRYELYVRPGGSDVDIYEFTGLVPGATFLAEIESGEFDTILHWFDDSGSIIATDDDSGTGLLSLLVGTIPQSGNVQIGVAGFPDFGAVGEHLESGLYALAFTYGSPVSSWLGFSSEVWSDPANWSDAVPDRADRQAYFGPQANGPSGVLVDTNVNVSGIIFDNAAGSYTLLNDGVHAIMLTGAAVVNVAAGAHTIESPLVGSEGLVKTGGGRLELVGTHPYTGTTTVAEGTLLVNGSYSGGGTYSVNVGGTLGGTGVIQAPVVVAGRLAPGNSPGILQIQGNYTQLPTGVLEIEVGGLEPGTQHDQLVVTGTATLAGVLQVPIIDNFHPIAGDEILFLTAGEVVGTFSGLVSPNLASVSSELAMSLTYGPSSVRLQFVAPSSDNQFSTQAAVSGWADPETWSSGEVPDSTNIIVLKNLSNEPQQVIVANESAFAHQLSVTGDTAPITVGVQNSSSLSATTGVTIANNATITLDNGNLVSPVVEVQGGGQIGGNGVVVGNLAVGTTQDEQQATLSPGLSVGHLGVVGSYRQGDHGTLLLEVEGVEQGQFDTISVSGAATLGGTITFDATNLEAQSGTFRFFTAGSADPLGEPLVDALTNVETVGNDAVFIALSVGGQATGSGDPLAGTFSVDGEICSIGDMNCSGAIDMDDVPLFAQALRSPTTFHQFTLGAIGKIIFANDAGNVDGSNNGIDFDDIDDFAMIVSGAGSGSDLSTVLAAIRAELGSVPEPSSSCCLLVGGWLLAAGWPARHRRRQRIDGLPVSHAG